jgi:hypothetical protein
MIQIDRYYFSDHFDILFASLNQKSPKTLLLTFVYFGFVNLRDVGVTTFTVNCGCKAVCFLLQVV